MTVKSIGQFLDDYKNNRLSRVFKSDPLPDPKKESMSYVKTLVGNTWT